MAFTLTLEHLEKLLEQQSNRCALTGLEFSAEHRPSIDRVDSDGGYTVDNVQLTWPEANVMKMALPQPMFVALCEAVARHAAK